MTSTKTRDWQDVVWEELDYADDAASLYGRIKGREEFISFPEGVNSFVSSVKEYMQGTIVIESGLIRPNLPRGKLWHATNASKLPGILGEGLKPQKGYDHAGLTVLEGPDGYVNLPCIFLAQHPGYAVFKRGIRGMPEKSNGRFLRRLPPRLRKFWTPQKNISGDSEGPLALLEIDSHELRARRYKLFPAYPDSYPVSSLSPREDLENAIERGEHGKLEIGVYRTIKPEPEIITGVYVDERATMRHNPEFRIVKVKPITSGPQSWRGWNRAVVEASYSR